MKITDKLMKQRNIGKTWGKFAVASSQIAIFMSAYMLLMVLINAYVPISKWAMDYFGIYLRFWVFIVIAATPVVLAYVLAWTLLVSSFYQQSVSQFMQQNPELTDGLKDIREIKSMMKSEFKEIKDRISELEQK